MDDFLAILGAIALIIATVLVLPFISFWLCYFGGWVASITIGNILTDGLNTLFQTTWFTKVTAEIDGVTRSSWEIDKNIPLFVGEGREYIESLIQCQEE